MGRRALPRDVQRATQLYERLLSDYEDVEAMKSLGNLLLSGAEGVEEDADYVVELFERAMDCGDLEAVMSVALICKEGAGAFPRDTSRATHLLMELIEDGDAVAIVHLAHLVGKDVLEGTLCGQSSCTARRSTPASLRHKISSTTFWTERGVVSQKI